jgi:hypothetical protein
MVDQSLVDRKLRMSFELAARLKEVGAPLLAVYWEWQEEMGRWELVLVPNSPAKEHELIKVATEVMIEPPYRSVFSLLDVAVNARQIERARAIGAYIRTPDDLGRRFDTTFTGGHYFEGVIVIYLSPEFARAHRVA